MALPQTFQQAPNEYRGVKGWLLFFCIGLTILSPLSTVAGLARGFSVASRVADRLPAFMTAMAIESVLAVLTMALGIFAGVSLWTVKPNAVRVAKLYLIVVPVYAVLDVALSLAILRSKAIDTLIESTISVLGSIFYSVLWLSYLKESKRVKATYFERNGDGSENISLNNRKPPAPFDPAQDAPQQPTIDAVEPANQPSEPLSEEKRD